mgnify:CR=1 FL=1
MKRIGVLALQGAFTEHIEMLRRIGAEAVPVRLPRELEAVNGVVIPGGESTTIGKLMVRYELAPALKKLIADGLPVLGTCAGMILLAREVTDLNEYSLGVLDISVRRNAFGRQVDSFETDLPMPALGGSPFHAVFIRAPWIERVGKGVEVLASLPDGRPVAARSGNLVAAAFHPELALDTRFHRYFLNIVDESCRKSLPMT